MAELRSPGSVFQCQLWRKVIVINMQKSCFLTGYERVKTKGMVKYASEVLYRQYPSKNMLYCPYLRVPV